MLPAFLAEDADFRARFRQEAIAIARLRHPAILVVFDYGEQDGTPYLVGEYLENGTLADQLGAPLPLQQVLRLLVPIADALDFAHAQGIVHRDGRPVLSDFGLAKMLDGQRRLTQSGMVLGTPHYMAPEIASGETGPSIDRYALVVIAYEMLTGLLPFDASTPHALLMLHVQQPVPPPRVRNPAVLRTVEAVLLRGLEKSPDARYPTATAFVTALREAGHAVAGGVVGESNPSVASPHPHASAPPTLKLLAAGGAPQPRASSVWRRVPRPTPLGAGLVALLVAGGGIAAYKAPSSQPPAGAAAGIWTAAGSLDAPVAFAQAMRLPDGNALVVGGSGPDANGRLADEYDAARGIWIALPAMPTPRSRFTATALANGYVLVTGGNTGSTMTAGSQVYDPGHHVWRATGALRFARQSHAAVRLRDGTVLVAGGRWQVARIPRIHRCAVPSSTHPPQVLGPRQVPRRPSITAMWPCCSRAAEYCLLEAAPTPARSTTRARDCGIRWHRCTTVALATPSRYVATARCSRPAARTLGTP